MSDILYKMYIGLRVKYPLFFPDFNSLDRFSKKKFYDIKFKEHLSSGCRVVTCGETDNRTESHGV